MNLLKTIIERLNQRVEVANIFDKQFNLCELNANGNDKAWVHYIGNGQAEVVTNFDAKNGTLFWAKRGKVSVAKTDAYKMSGCKQLYVTTFPLTAYAIVRKSHLPCDAEDAQDWLASRVYKLTSGTDPLFKQSIGVINYEVVPSGYANEIKTLTANYEWACVSVDMDVQVITTSEDGCYDTCATGDIPLPDLQPCTPCLNEVAVDGVTIIGNGTTADPLVAVGGEGSSILLQTDNVDNGSQTILNLKEGTNITITDDSVGGITINASGDLGVTDVTATAPLSSSGGNTPDISIQPANLFDDGYLTSADFTSFYNKFDVPTGLSTDYLDGTGTPTPFPTIPTLTSELTNDSGFITIGDVPTQVNSDWNATSGFAEILNKPTIPAAQIQSDWNQSNNVALDYIKNKPTIPTNGLPSGGTAGQILTKVDATDYNATWQENYADWTSVVKHIVKNNGASGTITKGTAVYVTGSNGTNMLVGRASNASEATSSKTMGLMESDITTTGTTQTGFVITEGLLGNLNTAGTTAGDPVWLGVNGALIYGLINKPYAPAHLVFIGIVTKVSAGNGEIFVKVQNGFELKEIHDVDIITTTPINGHILGFDGTLWVNKTIATWLGFTPVTDARTISTTAPLTGGGDLSADRTLAIADAAADGSTKGAAAFTANDFNAASGVISIDYTNGQAASASNKGFLTAADWTTFNGKASMGIYKNTTDGATSSATANTFSQSVLVPANSVVAGNILEFKLRGRKTGTAGLYTIRLYANTTNNLSGTPILLATYSGGLQQALGQQLNRTAAIKNATTNTEMFLATTSLATDFTNNVISSISVDWTSAQYIIGAVQCVSALDSSLISLISMTII